MTQNPFDALGAGGFDMNALLQQAQQMQEQLQRRPGAARRGHGRRHRRRRRGHRDRQRRRRAGRASTIKAGQFDGGDADDLSDLGDMIVAAYRDAKAQADALAAEALGPLAGGLGGLGGGAPGGRRPSSGSSTPMYEGVVQDLIDELGRLPGVGPKSAQRIAFHLLQADPADVRRLADVLVEVKAKVRFCSICFNVSEDEQCRICRDPRRDPAVLCVVEEYKDVVAIERTREFRGRYHVLGGAISPIDGIGPDQLRIRELMTRLGRRQRSPR